MAYPEYKRDLRRVKWAVVLGFVFNIALLGVSALAVHHAAQPQPGFNYGEKVLPILD